MAKGLTLQEQKIVVELLAVASYSLHLPNVKIDRHELANNCKGAAFAAADKLGIDLKKL